MNSFLGNYGADIKTLYVCWSISQMMLSQWCHRRLYCNCNGSLSAESHKSNSKQQKVMMKLLIRNAELVVFISTNSGRSQTQERKITNETSLTSQLSIANRNDKWRVSCFWEKEPINLI